MTKSYILRGKSISYCSVVYRYYHWNKKYHYSNSGLKNGITKSVIINSHSGKFLFSYQFAVKYQLPLPAIAGTLVSCNIILYQVGDNLCLYRTASKYHDYSLHRTSY